MSRMVNLDVLKYLSKLIGKCGMKSELQRLKIFAFQSNVVFVVDKVFYEHIKLVYLSQFTTSYFVKEMVISLSFFVRLELYLHNNDLFPLYPAYNLPSNI